MDMGYCRTCEHLTSRHNCKKYNKKLAYSGMSSRSLSYSAHERCSECNKDFYIQKLEKENERILSERWEFSNGKSSYWEKMKIYIDWCERTGNEVTGESYQEFMAQQAIEEIFKDNWDLKR